MEVRQKFKRANRSQGCIGLMLFPMGYWTLFYLIWRGIITGNPDAHGRRARVLAQLGQWLGVNHRPSPEEDRWVWSLAIAMCVALMGYLIYCGRRDFRRLDATMTEADWAAYRGAHFSVNRMFGQKEMVVPGDGWPGDGGPGDGGPGDGGYLRIPYKQVTQVKVTVLSSKKAYKVMGYDLLTVTWDDGRSLELQIAKAHRALDIAGRIASANQLAVDVAQEKR